MLRALLLPIGITLLVLLAALTLDAAHAQDIPRALHRRAAWPPPVELRFGPGVDEARTSLAGMPSC